MVKTIQTTSGMVPERRTVTAREAFAELGIKTSTGYQLIAEGKFPCPVIRAGKRVYVSRAALEKLLDPTNEAA